MGKQSKWLKWKVGGGVFFSLAVMFNIAKADPEFVKAVQAAQDTNDSTEVEDESDYGQNDPYTDNVKPSDDNESQHELALNNEQKPQPNSEIQTHDVPRVGKSAENQPTKKEAPTKHGIANKRINKPVPKQTTPSIVPKSSSVESKQPAVNKPPVPAAYAEQQNSVPPAQPPADIPVAPPTEDNTVTESNNSSVNTPTEESTTQSETDSTSTQKKSHSKSHHS